MLFTRTVSEGLSHYSYLIGDQGQAVVIDPRRDCETYFQAASAEGLRITHILETHRNEDYVTGSVELASRTGATILRSAHSDLGLPGLVAKGLGQRFELLQVASLSFARPLQVVYSLTDQ